MKLRVTLERKLPALGAGSVTDLTWDHPGLLSTAHVPMSSSTGSTRKPIGCRRTPVPMHLRQHHRPLARHVGHLQLDNNSEVGGVP